MEKDGRESCGVVKKQYECVCIEGGWRVTQQDEILMGFYGRGNESWRESNIEFYDLRQFFFRYLALADFEMFGMINLVSQKYNLYGSENHTSSWKPYKFRDLVSFKNSDITSAQLHRFRPLKQPSIRILMSQFSFLIRHSLKNPLPLTAQFTFFMILCCR